MMKWTGHPAKRDPAGKVRSMDDGFTLLEIIVATAILGLSMAMLLGIFTQTLGSADESRKRMEARVLAQTLMADALSARAPTSLRGTGEGGMTWRVSAGPYDAGSAAPGALHAVKIEADVQWPSHGGEATLSLTTLRFAGEDHAR